ncbi:hypothetical protein B0H66DRAFT_607770 [Apodospora peruviana]|uniref:Uncharacterized protein n=1 Tax=Apodospora peruviana TaxID=516989 RepID=A0AAE0LZL0_9PEZI|nr:hypothetical protein B0H66DRAFT_607770 [Apodospora peruviana]
MRFSAAIIALVVGLTTAAPAPDTAYLPHAVQVTKREPQDRSAKSNYNNLDRRERPADRNAKANDLQPHFGKD